MRCFLALLPDPDTALALERWRALACATLQRPVPIQNLHITLCFLGEPGPAAIDQLQRRLDTLALTPFTLELDELGYWPESKSVYLAPPRAAPELDALARHCRGAANRVGIRVDKRPFQAHVTLGRGQTHPPPPPLLPPRILWPVEGFALQRSTLAAGGARYDTLQQWDAWH